MQRMGNTMKKLELWIIAAEIEWHWLFIKKARKRGNSLLSRGMPLTSRKLCLLNRKLTAHSTKVIRNQMIYEELAKAI